MPTIAKLVVRLSLDNNNYKKGLAASVKAAQEAEKQISKSTQKSTTTGSQQLSRFGQAYQKLASSIKASPLAQSITSGLTKTLSAFPKVNSLVSGLASGMGKMGAAGKAAFGVLAKGAGMMGAGMAAGLGLAVAGITAVTGAAWKLASTAAPMQGISMAFQGIASQVQGGSQAMLAALQKSTMGMVSNIELMRQFNLASQLVGIEFAKNLPAAMEPIQKVAMATGQDIGFLMNSLTVGIGRLSPMILDNLGVQVDLNAAYQDFADKNGLVASSLTKTQQQAALTDQVITKLNENTKNIPPVFGSASQVFQAFKTDLKNVADQTGMDLLPTFTQMFADFRKFSPVLKSFGSGFAGAFSGIANVGRSVIKGLASGMGIDLEALAGNSEQWGANIVTQLARGMAKAIGAVLSVLQQLGSVIAGWLAPGSPPKLLPELPAWGKNAADWFLQGMTKGNVTVLRDLSSQVESFLRSSMSLGGSSSQEIAKAVLAARSGLEQALATGGNVMSSLPAQMQGYASAMIASQQAAEKLKAAQDELNEVTKKYDDELSPISARLKEIQAERDKFANAQRASELNAILADESAPEDAKRFAQLELEELALQDQAAAIEAAKETAVNAAQEKISAAELEAQAAEERLQLEQDLLQHQIETNNLMADTIEKLSAMGAGGAGGAAAGGLADVMESMGGLGAMAPSLGSTMSELANSIMGEFDGVSAQAEAMGETWGKVYEGLLGKGGRLVTWWQTNFGEGGVWPGIMENGRKIIESQWGPGGTWDGNMKNLQVIGQRLSDWWGSVWGAGGVWAGIMDNASQIASSQWGEGGTWSGIIDNAKKIVDNLKERIDEQMDAIGSKIDAARDFVQRFKDALINFWEWLQDHIFNFQIKLPELPEWATPGSPIPLHTAWEDFGNYLNRATFSPDLDFDGGTMALAAAGFAEPVAASSGGNREVISIGGNTINNGMDLKTFEARVKRIVNTELKRR